ncbi:H+/Cl-antiporter ClcA [Granulicatella balaenopterae]|uniref:H+/Cl-antiporter ClcA n=1 Tax=Granulicatella balaenopterae TaxID=137733 RepID=A0A1H9NSQ1_9LACT|nr:ClC family H(+)/Cl(-) exchange transporter [Granulicatella balaenopterae]SER38353.1 H+/Cl-antiporter ClcA [Granulicatella balaenopterae]
MGKHKIISSLHSKVWYIGVGACVGAVAGVIVSLFRMSISHILSWVVSVYQVMQYQPLWLLAWIPLTIAVGLLLGQLVKKNPNIKGSGIPQVELHIQGKLPLNWWMDLWQKFVGGLLSIGSGLLLGREGPSIQLGASVGQGFAKVLHEPRSQENVLISSGAGAGLAAAFNAPIAGLMFVLEEVHHTFSPIVAVTTLTAAVVSNFVAQTIFGVAPALSLVNNQRFPLRFYGYIIGLGIFLGFAGWLYQRNTVALKKIFAKALPKVPNYYYGIISMLAIIPLGILRPDFLGGGGELILELVEGNPTISFLMLLFIVRFIFSMVSYGSGLPGGIFLPILSLGAILGLIYGKIVITYCGVPEEFLVSFVFFAMAGYFASIGKAPLTALLLVTEMVGGLNQLMPLGICTLSAFIVADLLRVEPIYEKLAEQITGEHMGHKEGRRTTFEVPIFVESPLVGKQIKEIAWPKEVILATIRRGAVEEIVKGDVVLQPGDILVAVTDKGIIAAMYDELEYLVKYGVPRMTSRTKNLNS